MTRLLRLAPLALAALVLAVGCTKPTARIHGTVKYQGKPLQEGAVVVMIDNMTFPADIKNGTYEVVGVPYGKAVVVVQVQEPRPQSRPIPNVGKDAGAKAEAAKDDQAKLSRMPAPPPPTGPTVNSAIPTTYGHPDTSGLGLDVSKPDHEYNIELD